MSILHDITHLLLPRRCPVCQRRLEYTERSLCAVCASCLPRLWLPGIDDNDMLRHLWTRVPVEHAFSLVAYRHNSPFHQLLMRIKYQSDTALAYRLGCVPDWTNMPMCWCLCPLPPGACASVVTTRPVFWPMGWAVPWVCP